MKCPKCSSRMDVGCHENIIICETCGASYCLEYLGYYPEGSDDIIEKGFEDEGWKKEVEEIKDHNIYFNEWK